MIDEFLSIYIEIIEDTIGRILGWEQFTHLTADEQERFRIASKEELEEIPERKFQCIM